MTANELAIEFGDAMADYLVAKAKRDEARSQCDHDWDHFGYRHYEEEIKKRAAFLGQALEAFVERRSNGSGRDS